MAKKRAKKAPADAGAKAHPCGEGYRLLERFTQAFEAVESFGDEAGADILRENFMEGAEAVAAAFERYLHHEARTLDDAFQVHRPKGYQLGSARKRFKKMMSVVFDGRTLRLYGAKADVSLFEALATMHGVNKTQASEWYYERNRNVKPDPARSRADLPKKFLPYIDDIEWTEG